MVAHKKYKALGRGLDALITDNRDAAGQGGVAGLPLSEIHPNPDQPRRDVDEEGLLQLTDSIRELGVVQPITVLKVEEGNYMIIAGERRWRAAGKAGLKTIPAYIKKGDDTEIRAMALVENIQREDLNAIEIALALRDMQEADGLTQEQTAQKVGMQRTTVANYLRLLGLPAEIQIAVQEGRLEQGHARALLGLQDAERQLALFHEMAGKHYTVRQIEARVQAQKRRGNARVSQQTENYQQLSQALEEKLGTKVSCKVSLRGRGTLSIAFCSEDDLMRIARAIGLEEQ